jgi:hypothetical protein
LLAGMHLSSPSSNSPADKVHIGIPHSPALPAAAVCRRLPAAASVGVAAGGGSGPAAAGARTAGASSPLAPPYGHLCGSWVLQGAAPCRGRLRQGGHCCCWAPGTAASGQPGAGGPCGPLNAVYTYYRCVCAHARMLSGEAQEAGCGTADGGAHINVLVRSASCALQG